MRQLVSWLTDYSYRKAGLVLVAVLLVLGFGGLTFTQVREDLIPDIDFPVITVVAQSPGGQPEDIVQNVITPIETSVGSLPGLKSTSSTAVAGLGVTVLNFEYGTDLDAADAAIKEALAGARLGSTVTTSTLKFDPSVIPVLDLSLQGDRDQAEWYRIAQTQIVPSLSRIDGVGSVNVSGGAVTEVVIALDRQKLVENGISYEQVAQTLRANNVVLPSGQLSSGDTTIPLQTVAVYRSLDEIRNIALRSTATASGAAAPVATPATGAATAPTSAARPAVTATPSAAAPRIVRLSDIATVNEAPAGSTGITRTNGQPAVGISIIKEKDANTVRVANAVKDELDQIEPNLPQGASLEVLFDQSEFITSSINGVIQDGLIGGALAIVIVYIFLANWRTTLVTAVSIPLSVVVAVVLLDRLGYSLNIMTLGGLTIAIGRVIDDSIVVLENIYRHMAQGEESYPATVRGAREVTIAIVGATATTCAVFLPLGLVGGLIGQLFLSFALAVVFALLASLLVAVTVIPVLTRFTIAGRVRTRPESHPGETRVARIYTPALRWALRHRIVTLGVSLLLLAGSLALVPRLPVQFLPDTGQKTITVTVYARPGQTQDSVLQQAIQVERLLPAVGATRYQTVIRGAGSDFSAVGNITSGRGANTATITVELPAEGPDKKEAASSLADRISRNVPNSQNISVSASSGSFGSEGIAIVVSADSPQGAAGLAAATEQVRSAVADVPDTANVTSDLAAAQQTLEIRVNPERAAAVGLTPDQISASLSNLSSNRTVTTADLGQGPRPIRLVLSGVDINNAQSLGSFEIVRGVPLSSVADIVPVTKQTTITRVDGRPAATITGDITTDNTGKVSQEAQQAAESVSLPDGVSISSGGVAADINEGFSKMFIAIGVSVALVYLIMALLFESLLTPFVILFSLPLAVIGAIVALYVTGSAVSVSALIGILMLVGIVVTNAIVLLEFVVMLRQEKGLTVYDALVEGAQTRVRPILMTAISAMLALIPLALGRTEGALIASDLGRVVIGGLFSSTLLTLLVVPVVFSYVAGMKSNDARQPHLATATVLPVEPSAEPTPVTAIPADVRDRDEGPLFERRESKVFPPPLVREVRPSNSIDATDVHGTPSSGGSPGQAATANGRGSQGLTTFNVRVPNPVEGGRDVELRVTIEVEKE